MRGYYFECIAIFFTNLLFFLTLMDESIVFFLGQNASW